MAKDTIVETGKVFVNPYNFVPFASVQPNRKKIEEWTGDLTGEVECELAIQTPLAIPDSALKEEDERSPKHFRYPFMRRDPQDDATAFIPGSEIRGMIRSVYEAATDSCMGILEDSRLTGRSTEFARECGLIKLDRVTNQWFLYKSKPFLLPSFQSKDYVQGLDQGGMYIEDIASQRRFRQGEKIRFDYIERESDTPRGKIKQQIVTQIGKGNNTGYLLIAEKGLNAGGLKGHKYSHVIQAPGNGETGIQLNEGEVENLKEVVKYYQDEKLNNALKKDDGTHFGYKGYAVSETDYTPVFCHKIGERYLLSPAMQGREVYGNSLRDFVGGYTPCLGEKGADCVCPACALFGKTGKELSYGSRVRFSDAIVRETLKFDKNNKYATLKELSSPKVSSTEFYTQIDRKGGNPKEWNYLYQKSANPSGKGNLYSLLNKGQLHLRGRKFYLHQHLPDFRSTEKTERNSSVEIVESGSFRFKVYFENLTEWELSRLLWCLAPFRIVGDQEKQLYHKIGHGRPLGLGSVRTKLVSGINLRTVSMDENGSVTYNPSTFDYQREQTEAKIPETLKNVLSFAIPNVRYPMAADKTNKNEKNASAGHQWFMMNRTAAGTGNDHNVKYVLPYLPVTEKTPEEIGLALQLPEMEKSPGFFPANSCGKVDMKYQAPQKSPWHGIGSIPANAHMQQTASESQVTSVRKDGCYTVPIIRIIPEKKDIYCRMPDGLEGYVRVFNRDISKFKAGQNIPVLALEKDTKHNNWKIRLC